MDPIEIIYNESKKCDTLRSRKIRRRPDSCHPFHAEENARECGDGLALQPCPAVLMLSLILALCQRWQRLQCPHCAMVNEKVKDTIEKKCHPVAKPFYIILNIRTGNGCWRYRTSRQQLAQDVHLMQNTSRYSHQLSDYHFAAIMVIDWLIILGLAFSCNRLDMFVYIFK